MKISTREKDIKQITSTKRIKRPEIQYRSYKIKMVALVHLNK